MNIKAQYAVAASPERVYASLTDPAVLQRCIPGCESLTATDENRYNARIKIGIAGLKGTYAGRAELRDRQPPHGFTLVVDGKSTGPGIVHATARIALTPVESGAQIACDADVQVAGLLAAVGSRLIEAVARQQMDEFFRRIGAEFTSSPAS